jgi:putative ABC transport system permease protein
MVVITWIMTDSFKGDLEGWLDGYMGGDLYISSAVPMKRDVQNRLLAVEGVQAVAPVRYFQTEWSTPEGNNETISIMAVEPQSYTEVTSFTFVQNDSDPLIALNQLAVGDSVFISSVIAEKHDLKPGDSIKINTRRGLKDFYVSAIIVDFYNQGMVITGSWNDMERYFRYEDANLYLVKTSPEYSASNIADEIDRKYGKRDRLSIVSNKSILDQITSLMQQAFSMFDILALIAILVGFFGIMNTLTMNVVERTQEIGMLRSIGMTRTQSVMMIVSEAAVMGMIGGLLGIVFGIILSRIFLTAMVSMSGYSISYIIPYQRIIAAFILAFLVSQIAAFFPAMRAVRTHILEAIQYE